jgi:hypothetical protein
MKRFYVEANNLKPLITWLKTRPSGQLQILVGNSESTTISLADSIINEGTGLVLWVYGKLQRNELLIYPILDKTTTFKVGIVVESEHYGTTA